MTTRKIQDATLVLNGLVHKMFASWLFLILDGYSSNTTTLTITKLHSMYCASLQVSYLALTPLTASSTKTISSTNYMVVTYTIG